MLPIVLLVHAVTNSTKGMSIEQVKVHPVWEHVSHTALYFTSSKEEDRYCSHQIHLKEFKQPPEVYVAAE